MSSNISRSRDSRLIFIAGVVLTLLCCISARYHPSVLLVVENAVYDVLLKNRTLLPSSGRVVIVDVDDRSLEEFGQWPWPRYRMAGLVQTINDFGAACIGLDMIFAEPDRTSLARLGLKLRYELGVELSLRGIQERFLDNDRSFAKALGQAPVILGYAETFDAPGVNRDTKIPRARLFVRREAGVAEEWADLGRSAKAILPLQVLATQSSGLGFVNSIADSDGTLRRVPVVMVHNGELVPSLALACYLETLNRPGTLELRATGEMTLRFDGVTIPLDARGNILVPYRGKKGVFPRYSARDVLSGSVSPQALKDMIVIIGTSAAGLKDLRVTPFDADYPGAEVHATIIDSLIQGDSISYPAWIRGLEQVVTLVLGVIMTVFLTRSGAGVSLLVLGGAVLGNVLVSRWGMAQGLFFSPFYPVLVCAAIFSFLSLLKFWREERAGVARLRELAVVQEVMVETMANVTETRDPETGGHIKRTQHYVAALLDGLRTRPEFASVLDDWFAEELRRSAPLHDIGKVGVPDRVLLKPGRLDPEEFAEIRKHTVYGRRIIEEAEKRLGRNSFLRMAGELAGTHHEKWDGSGYPEGLAGTDIPLSGRIMAIADVYDALIARRPYKKPFTHEKTVDIIREGRGTHFDPDVTDVFLKIHERFREIAITHADSDEERAFLAGRQGEPKE